MPYRGLLLDYGGVLTSSVLDSFEAFCLAEGVATDLVKSAFVAAARSPDSIFHQVEVGAIDQDEFDRRLASILSQASGKTIAPVGLKQRLFAGSSPDEPMLAATRTFKANGVRTALVSNSWGGADYPRESFGELFDAVIISGEVGMRKPDGDIYLLAARTIGVPPEECIFVDDFRVNAEGANAVGMHGILHSSTAETLAELSQLLGVPL